MLEIKNLTVGYGQTTVLRDVSMSVGESSVVAVLGPNGAGKTTLLKAVAGHLRPSKGTVRFLDQDVTGLRPYRRARLGMCHIPEGRGIYPAMTVRENLVLQAPRAKEAEVIARAAESFPVLGKRLEQIAGSLSGGEQQMLALVRAYLGNPRLVLVDEASTGLAPIVIDQIFVFLAEIATAGTSLVIVDQYVARPLALAHNAYVLARGRVAFEGEASALAEHDIFDTYLGTDPA